MLRRNISREVSQKLRNDPIAARDRLTMEAFQSLLPLAASIGAAETQISHMGETMAWTAPAIEEVTCGMEINMYFPAEEEAGDLF
jgi:coenzyme PQQ precursor peptide PqqA